MNAEVSTHVEGSALAAPNPLQIIDAAVKSGIKAEDLRVLYELHKDAEDRAAAREFDDALADFQRACPPIKKNKSSKKASGGGGGFAYRYASLDEIERTVRPLLTERGLSYTWDMKLDAGAVYCTCVLRGKGHSISAMFVAPIDKGGSMNDIQKHGSALTYAKRYSLEQVLGLSTSDDIDAVAPEDRKTAPIDAKQAGVIRDYLDQLDPETEQRFLGWCGVGSITEIPSHRYEPAVAMLKKKVEAAQ